MGYPQSMPGWQLKNNNTKLAYILKPVFLKTSMRNLLRQIFVTFLCQVGHNTKKQEFSMQFALQTYITPFNQLKILCRRFASSSVCSSISVTNGHCGSQIVYGDD